MDRLPRVLNAGQGWIAIDKPPGMSVHNDPDGDALSATLEILKADSSLQLKCGWKLQSFTPAAVHRLDRETSGVLLLATNQKTASELGQAMEAREARKIYRAVLRGRLALESGTWETPLTDRAEGRKNPAGSGSDRKTCTTRFLRTRVGEHLTEVEVELLTGRQHQIRRHAAIHKHAVVGDKRYGDLKFNERIKRLFDVDRLLLHACLLELHIGGRPVRIESELPKEFGRVFDAPKESP